MIADDAVVAGVCFSVGALVIFMADLLLPLPGESGDPFTGRWWCWRGGRKAGPSYGG